MSNMSRRDVLRTSTFLAGAMFAPVALRADVPAGRDPFDYEVTRTEAEWRTRLGEAYPVMREGKTEAPMSSRIWAEARAGRYECKGCDLVQYRSELKIHLPKGWLFFVASEPNAQMMSQDNNAEMGDEAGPTSVDIEVHCRRCGSHMGHILLVEGRVLHCINGASLNFVPDAA